MVPYFTKNFAPLIGLLKVLTFGPGEEIFGFETVPTMFYVVKHGRVKFEDKRLAQTGQSGSTQSTAMIRVEGEWFGFESLLCGPYAEMTHEDLLRRSITG